MKNKVIDRISVSNEVLNALPKNNVSNTEKYIKEANKIYASYNKVMIQIIAEMQQRNKIIDDNIKEEITEIEDISAYIEELSIFNPLTEPYEKLHLDELTHYLKPEYDRELSEINEYLIEIIKIFKLVGCQLTKEDFYYGNVEQLYMETLLDYEKYSYLKSKEVFERYYWESPNLIGNIYLNIRSLYYKKKEYFYRYIKEYQMFKKTKYSDILTKYQETFKTNKLKEDTSSRNYLDKFINGDLSISDYTEKNINNLQELIFNSNPDYITINNLNKTLEEYQIYLKYIKILTIIKEKYDEIKDKKINSSGKLKEIIKLDNIIYKLKKKEKDFSKHIEKIQQLYNEYDELYYQEKLKKFLNKNSKYDDVVFFLISFYKYYFQIYKDLNLDITIKEIKKDYQELREVLINPFNNLINRLDLTNGYNVPKIIVNKYMLNNIKISEKDLDEDNLNSFVKAVNILNNYNKIINLEKIDYKTIVNYYKLDEFLKNIDNKYSKKT